MPRQKRNKESEAIRRMIHGHLQRKTEVAAHASTLLAASHLDEDALAAFVEGTLSELESKTIVSHLVACAACRRISAQLIRLQSAVGGNEFTQEDAATPPTEPGRFRRLLDDLASRVLPDAGDREVFAYHAPAEDFEAKEKEKEKEETEDENGNLKS
ncbi:MAG: hypothetical protein H0V27_09285 [Pyrinomonadaceae bacterium]|nr:hypothetical protein [Pyrinomonadaceae bacterium]